jgi:hypothetical protein
MSKPIESGPSVLRDLNAKFCHNLGQALADEEPLASKAELQARAIPVVAKILSHDLELTGWQHDALCMFDEIFADVICSIYLSACGLDKPAHMILRRALEVGTATVYVWDLPHLFCGWKDHDQDLTFNEMLEHFTTQGFNSFVRSQNPHYKGTEVIDVTLARRLYRKLSNIIHGKMTTFESVLPDKFQHSQDDWRSHLEQVCEVERILLALWENRFCCVSEQLLNELPQLRMQRTNENDPQV